MNTFKTFLAATVLCLTAVSANAQDIIWKQPSEMPGYRQNLHFEGNAILNKSDVRKLQRSLANKGFYRGRIDGIWGGQTTQAILDYQAVHEDAQTGTVTNRTLRDLGVYVNEDQYRNNRYRDDRYQENRYRENRYDDHHRDELFR